EKRELHGAGAVDADAVLAQVVADVFGASIDGEFFGMQACEIADDGGELVGGGAAGDDEPDVSSGWRRCERETKVLRVPIERIGGDAKGNGDLSRLARRAARSEDVNGESAEKCPDPARAVGVDEVRQAFVDAENRRERCGLGLRGRLDLDG